MKFAIIAAGEGSRLAQEGVECPKPLVKLCGEPMIERLIRIFTDNNAEEIVIVINEYHKQTEDFLRDLELRGIYAPLRIIVRTTPSSMHSFYELSSYLKDAPFCLTTVDTIFREEDFHRYIEEFKKGEYDGLMAVTDYVDDEKPLYVSTDSDGMINAFNDENGGERFISGGIYCLSPISIDTLYRCMNEGQSRMRNFQRGLIADGLKLKSYLFTKILDVDHAGDIIKAENFLKRIEER